MKLDTQLIDVRIRIPISGFEGEQGGALPPQISTVSPTNGGIFK